MKRLYDKYGKRNKLGNKMAKDVETYFDTLADHCVKAGLDMQIGRAHV